MMRERGLCLFVVMLAAMFQPVSGQTRIGNLGEADIPSLFYGQAGGLSLGQTFRLPNSVDTRLSSFTLALNSFRGDAVFRGILMEWNHLESRPEGEELFRSEDLPGNTQPEWWNATPVTFDINELQLDPDATYIFFINIESPWIFEPRTLGSRNAQGQGVYNFHTGESPPELRTGWHVSDLDYAHEAHFVPGTAVPEPSSSVLIMTGLAALGLVRRMKEGGKG